MRKLTNIALIITSLIFFGLLAMGLHLLFGGVEYPPNYYYLWMVSYVLCVILLFYFGYSFIQFRKIDQEYMELCTDYTHRAVDLFFGLDLYTEYRLNGQSKEALEADLIEYKGGVQYYLDQEEETE